jgi:hypothetical protein
MYVLQEIAPHVVSNQKHPFLNRYKTVATWSAGIMLKFLALCGFIYSKCSGWMHFILVFLLCVYLYELSQAHFRVRQHLKFDKLALLLCQLFLHGYFQETSHMQVLRAAIWRGPGGKRRCGYLEFVAHAWTGTCLHSAEASSVFCKSFLNLKYQ